MNFQYIFRLGFKSGAEKRHASTRALSAKQFRVKCNIVKVFREFLGQRGEILRSFSAPTTVRGAFLPKGDFRMTAFSTHAGSRGRSSTNIFTNLSLDFAEDLYRKRGKVYARLVNAPVHAAKLGVTFV